MTNDEIRVTKEARMTKAVSFLRPSSFVLRHCPRSVLALACAFLYGCSSAKPPKPVPAPVGLAEQTAGQAVKLSAAENWTAADTQWQKALDEYRLLNDRTNEAIALHNLAGAQRHAGKVSTAYELLESAAAINSALHRDQEWWRNQIALLQIEAQLQRTNELAQRFEKLRPLAKASSTQALFLNERGLWQTENADLDAAAADFREALRLFTIEKNESGVATVLANEALLLEKQNKFREAADKWQEALRRFERLADVHGSAAGLTGRGRSLLAAQPNLPEAKDVLQRGEHNFRLLHNETQAREVAELLKKLP